MPQQIDDIEIRSEEVQEILGTPPGWLVRWGSTVAFVAFVALVWVAYLLKYPDVVSSEIRVTSTEPARKIYSETTGYIARLLVRNEQIVDSAAALLAFKSTANVDDVLTFETILDQVKELDEASLLSFRPPTNLLLGEIQNQLYDFLQKQEQFRHNASSRSTRTNVRDLEKRIEYIERDIAKNNQEKRRVEDQLEALSAQFERDQRLYQEKKISLRRLRETQDAMRGLERDRQGVEADSKSKRFEIEMLRNQIRGARADRRETSSDAAEALKISFLALQAAVEEWRKRYLVVAPVRGMVAFTNKDINLAEQQFILKETELMSVVPTETTETLGRMLLSLDGSGKVDTGQQVIVKFKSYPFYEYGAVVGRVKWKGKIPSGNAIPVEIDFPDGLLTTRGKRIEPAQEMLGTGEIITSNKRVIEKIFEDIRRISN